MRITIAIVLLAVLVSGCASVPDAVKFAHQKQQESLENFQDNVNGFVEAAFGDLERALAKQVDDELAKREVDMTDADGKVTLEDYKAEMKAAAEKKAEDRAKIMGHLQRYAEMRTDLDNAIEIGEALDEWLNRKAFTADDVAAFLRKVDDILGG